MAFNSTLFILFLVSVIIINYFISSRYRISFLILASFIFIGYYSIPSLFTVLFSSLFNFYIAKKIQQKRHWYYLGLGVNISAIILFNYFNISHADYQFQFSEIRFDAASIVMALGLSFYSLQNISYISDIYFKRTEPVTDVTKYVLYISFFPKILSGPVLLPQEFFPQMNNGKPKANMIASGINLFLYGLFKKIVLADRLSYGVNAVFEGTHVHNGLATLIGIYLFTIQLYFDFSGYTDMAFGISKMLGINLKDNFKTPFRSTSISEFWRRWHISLINWFTSYIYFPVVYSLRNYATLSVFVGIALTFLVSAIWHGIGLTFILWALCHVIYIYIERIAAKSYFQNFVNLKYIGRITAILLVFNAVAFSNIFFRSHSVSKAFQLIKTVFSTFTPDNWLSDVLAPLVGGGNPIDTFNASISLLLILLTLTFENTLERLYKTENINILLSIILLVFIMVFAIFDSGEQFIYMQF
jgi:alginate O-acetyltransferase complex protein AlgI